MNHLDLFSGIGGFSLAAGRAGIDTVGFSEIDPYACAVLKKNFPNIKNYGDIRQITRETLVERVDIITGGFPCQPFSTAGKRNGTADDRFLWPEMLRVIKEFKPTWIVGENVAGFVNMELDRAATDLEAEGYEVQPIIIPALSVGAPHRRDRVWIIAHAERERLHSEEDIEVLGGEGGCELHPSESGFNAFASTEDLDDLLSKTATMCPGEDNGIPNRMDRIKCLGNAIVPQVAYEILVIIRNLEENTKSI